MYKKNKIFFDLIKPSQLASPTYPKSLKSFVIIQDFGSNMDFFLIKADKKDDIFFLENLDLKQISSSHLLWGIVSNAAVSFYIGMSYKWLFRQLKEVYKIEVIENKAQKILANWDIENSFESLKHIDFLNRYSISSHKYLIKSSYFFSTIYHFLSQLELELQNKEDNIFKTIELEKVREIEEKVTQHINKPIPTVKEMAIMAGMSSSKFKILFHEIYGQSPHNHIIEKKMLHAKNLLQTGQFSITQVAYKVGYNHVSGFTRIFKKIYKKSPKSFIILGS